MFLSPGRERKPVVYRHSILEDRLDLLDTQETFSSLASVVDRNCQYRVRRGDVAIGVGIIY